MNTSQPPTRKPPVAGFFVGIGFLIVAVLMAMMPSNVDIPIVDQPIIPVEQIVPGAFRVALADPPMVNLGTYDQRCNDCHGLFENARAPDRELTQHTNIVLEHGINDSCLNCHDQDNREKLVLRNGETIGFDRVELLCSQCHGPIYNDWKLGSHGKTIGYWNTDLGEAIKLTCSQCHEPHSPAYEPMVPLRGPNTLRMGDQSGEHETIDERNPLQRWRLIDNDAHKSSQEHGGDHE